MSDLSPHGITRSAPHADAGLLTGLLRDPPQATAPSTSLLHLLFERCADPLALLDGDLRLVRVNDALVQLFSGNWGGRAAGLAGLLQAHERPPRLERALRTGVAELAVPLGPDGQLVADAHPIVEEGGGARMVLAFRPEPPSAPDPPHLLPLGRALARSGSRADVCQALLDDARARGAAAAVFLPMPNGHSLQMAAQEGYAEPVVEIFRVIELTEPLPATEVFRHGEPLYIGSAGEWERHFGPACGFRPAGPSASAAVLPLPGADDVLGVLAHSYPGARTFTAAERATLELVGSMAGAALRRLDLEERAAAARRAKADFLGILSHEFRTPLSAILGYIDLVESAEGERLTERQADRLGRARRSAWHLTELVDGMLQLARMEKGLEACQPRRVDVAELVRDAVGLFEQPARAKGLALGVSGADAPVHIATDAAKVRQVLLNVLGNAVKFTASGSIHTALSVRPGSVRIEVADTGAGIAPEHRPHLFEAFWQADQTDTRTAPGVGLGLAVTRKLLDLLGGSARITPNTGGGTRVSVRLPLEPPG